MENSKNNKKRTKKSFNWKKAIIGSTIVVGVTLPITLLSFNWNNLRIIYATGSSSVFPLMKKLSDTYGKHKPEDEPLIDVTCEATGSGAGLEKVLNGYASFGNISFSPTNKYFDEHPTTKDNWSKLNMKTITLGIDGIGLVYKADVDLDINENNIVDIFSAFAGFKQYSFQELQASGKDAEIKVIPYAKTGGKAKSGTADAFLNDSNLANAKKLPANINNALKSGGYGENTVSTKESQPETWKQMLSANKVGTIGYLSTGFILQNEKEIKDKGFKIATYNGHELSSETLKTGDYNWRRKLNTLVSLKENQANSEVRTWVEWLFDNYHEPWMQEVYRSVGVNQLDQAQIDTMKKEGNFWVSDFDIHPLANGDYSYGAQIQKGGN